MRRVAIGGSFKAIDSLINMLHPIQPSNRSRCGFRERLKSQIRLLYKSWSKSIRLIHPQ